jgi:hypothetical protein
LAPPALSLFIQYGNLIRRSVETGQKVRVEGLDGEFIVVSIDREAAVADLMLTTGTHRLENQVPLKSIHPLPNGRRPKSR